jgi:Cdc6-like AAA superfamily ATPase
MAELEAGLDSAVISGEISMSEEEKQIEEEKADQEEVSGAAEEVFASVPEIESAVEVDAAAEKTEKESSRELAEQLSAVPEEESDIMPDVATILDTPSTKTGSLRPVREKTVEEEEPEVPVKKPVPQDTGFIIEARYDLEATSEIGTRVGLTDDQKEIFSYFVPVRGMSEQIVEVLSHDKYCRGRAGSSRTGNILVIGHKGSGKTVLAVDVVKSIQRQRQGKGGKVAIVNAASLNKKNISDIFLKLKGGALIIEEAGKLHPRTVEELNVEMEKQTGELLVILEEERDPLKSLLRSNVRFAKKFTAKLEVPVFTNDELVTFAQTYAKENGFKLDDLAILALYSRIDTLQKENHAVSITEVKDILDEAMNHSKKSRMKKFAKRLRGKNEDEEGRTILNEHDFV